MRRPIGALLLSLAAALILGTAGCLGGRPRLNVVVVVLDTVRQDHTSCYGYSRDTTPRLRRLAAESTLYKNAYSVSAWTSPAHASLFTGLHPSSHHSNQEQWRLDAKFVTMAELLGGAGYRTMAIVENPLVSRVNGFDQGFDVFLEPWRTQPNGRPSQKDNTIELAHDALARLRREGPFFLFLNLMEAHNPYNSSRQFLSGFVTDRSIGVTGTGLQDYYLGRRKYSEAELTHLRELYDAEILYDDWVVGGIIDDLKAESLWNDTIFVVLSDHGENIGDHGHVDHVFSLYESVTRIPLIIHNPRHFTPGRVDEDPTQITDVFPTIANILGIESLGAQGVDLLRPGARKGRAVVCEYGWPLQALRTFGDRQNDPLLTRWKRRLRSVTDGGSKLIWASDGKHELYDLSRDPAEERNLVDRPEMAEEVRRLTGLLERLYGRNLRGAVTGPAPAEEDLDEQTREELRALGYVR